MEKTCQRLSCGCGLPSRLDFLTEQSGIKATAWGKAVQDPSCPVVFSHLLRAGRAGRDVAHHTCRTWGPGRGSDCPRSHSKLLATEVPETLVSSEQTYHLIATCTTLTPEDGTLPEWQVSVGGAGSQQRRGRQTTRVLRCVT